MAGSPNQFLTLGEVEWRMIPSGFQVRWREYSGAPGCKKFGTGERVEAWDLFDGLNARLHLEWWEQHNHEVRMAEIGNPVR